jgi:succinate dehydrogenase/fumarate reductase cytochrome b subunit
MYGEAAWIETESIIQNPLYDLGMLLVIGALIFHGLNGIRLILLEYGLLIGKPTQPIYPYKPTLKRRTPRLLIILMMLIGTVFFLIALYEFLLVWGVLS